MSLDIHPSVFPSAHPALPEKARFHYVHRSVRVLRRSLSLNLVESVDEGKPIIPRGATHPHLDRELHSTDETVFRGLGSNAVRPAP